MAAMTTEERLDKLDRELTETKRGLARAQRRNRWLLIGAAACLGITLAWAFFGQAARFATTPAQGTTTAPALREVRANAFILVDEKGKTRAVLRMTEKGPVVPAIPFLGLFDETGRVRAGIQTRKFGGGNVVYDESTLFLCDENGQKQVSLDVNTGGAGLNLSDENGVTRVNLGVGKEHATLMLCDDDVRYTHARRPRLVLRADERGPELQLFDENSKVRGWLQVDKVGSQLCLYGANRNHAAMLSADTGRSCLFLSDLSDKNGGHGAKLDVDKDGPEFYLFGENHKVLWQAP